MEYKITASWGIEELFSCSNDTRIYLTRFQALNEEGKREYLQAIQEYVDQNTSSLLAEWVEIPFPKPINKTGLWKEIQGVRALVLSRDVKEDYGPLRRLCRERGEVVQQDRLGEIPTIVYKVTAEQVKSADSWGDGYVYTDWLHYMGDAEWGYIEVQQWRR